MNRLFNIIISNEFECSIIVTDSLSYFEKKAYIIFVFEYVYYSMFVPTVMPFSQ